MEDRKDKLFFHWSESLQRFDHLIAGILAAWMAYLVQSYRPTKLSLWPPTSSVIEALALVCILAALLACIRKIELNIALNRLSLDKSRRAEFLERRLLESSITPNLSPDLLTPRSRAEDKALLAQNDELYQQITKAMNTYSAGAWRWYCARNACGVLGIALLIGARILSAL